MSEKILVLLIGLLGGISVGIQSPITGALGQRPEGIASSVMVRLSGGDILVDSGSDHCYLYQTLLNFANRPEHLKFDEVAVYCYNLGTQSSLLSA